MLGSPCKLASRPLGPSAHFFPHLNQRLNSARRRNFVAVQPALVVGTVIGVLHSSHAHGRKLLSEISKLCGGELVVHGASVACFALSSPSALTNYGPRRIVAGNTAVYVNYKGRRLLTLDRAQRLKNLRDRLDLHDELVRTLKEVPI